MVPDPTKPYWVDDLRRKHEAYWYGDSRARAVTVEHEGRSLEILTPEFVPRTAIRVTASAGDLLFLVGMTLDEEDEDEDEEIIKGGDGVVIVARKLPERIDTYFVSVWHILYPETLRSLEG